MCVNINEPIYIYVFMYVLVCVWEINKTSIKRNAVIVLNDCYSTDIYVVDKNPCDSITFSKHN